MKNGADEGKMRNAGNAGEAEKKKNREQVGGIEKEKEKEGKTSGRKKLVTYLRELSIVVAGVAITFIVSALIGQCNETKSLKRYLEAVKTELADNLTLVREKEKFYDGTARLSWYLMSDDPENLEQDSIDRIIYNDGQYVVGSFFTLTYKTSAFEMLKNSGALNLIGSRELSRSILDSYAKLENTKHESDAYMARKMDVIYDGILDNEQVFAGDILNPKFRRVFYFFAAYLDLEKIFGESADQIEKTLAALDEGEIR